MVGFLNYQTQLIIIIVALILIAIYVYYFPKIVGDSKKDSKNS